MTQDWPDDEHRHADGLYLEPAEAYIRGSLPEAASLQGEALITAGRAAGLKLHRFKRTMGLPRVARAIGALRGVQPESLLDIGPGRGVALWPMMDAFPALPITVVEPDPRRRGHLEATARGGLSRLRVVNADGAALPFRENEFDIATVLEVLEHQDDPAPMARELVRVARRFVLASTPSKPDDNPEHVQLFTGDALRDLFMQAGAKAVSVDYVLNHIVVLARIQA